MSRIYVKNNPQLLLCNFNVPVHHIQDVETIKPVLKTIEEDYGKDLSGLFFIYICKLHFTTQGN